MGRRTLLLRIVGELMTLKINFTEPLANNQQIPCLHALKELGFRAERITQNSRFIKWHFSGRLPTVRSPDIVINISDNDKKIYRELKNITYVDFDLYFERKKDYENI